MRPETVEGEAAGSEANGLVGEVVSHTFLGAVTRLRVLAGPQEWTADLSAERAAAIEQSLARVTGRTVLMTTQVDPSIIGGMVARVGGTVFDASVTHQLQRLKQRLEESI